MTGAHVDVRGLVRVDFAIDDVDAGRFRSDGWCAVRGRLTWLPARLLRLVEKSRAGQGWVETLQVEALDGSFGLSREAGVVDGDDGRRSQQLGVDRTVHCGAGAVTRRLTLRAGHAQERAFDRGRGAARPFGRVSSTGAVAEGCFDGTLDLVSGAKGGHLG